ncbi:MAG: gliding motility-associated ABC transporter ATP-binding subunit GldA [Bacteroidales bacterium]|nr:gliding motility-associated ABC transporter ATP-binding subunit GldA [Bacteroidales bacterium]
MSIVVNGVTKLYGSQKVLDNISFEVKTGEIVGFLGPNGAGKSTLMKIITGFIPATSGRVAVNGLDVETNNIELKRQIGYLPENNPLYPEMYVREYLSFVASIYKCGKPRKKLIDDIIETTGLAPEQKKKIASLSKGYKQRVGLAHALIHNPAVLILDEATTGLDPNQIMEIRNLIREVGKEKTVLLSTHIMQEAEALCQRVIIIDRGVIMANEEKSKIYSLIKHARQVVTVEFDREIALSKLSEIRIATDIRPAGTNAWQIEAGGTDDIRPAIFKFAVDNNLTVLSLNKRQNNLEEIFRHLTN